jgi:CxxC-x17-CxxC domain-containing protein
MTNYNDQTLTCRDCGQAFAFTAGEQEFYAARGLVNTPSRCPECRAAHKAHGSSGSNRGYSANAGRGYSDRGQREMHEARCASCGGVARVPFVPRDDRPVYCSNCYNQSRATRY